MFPDIHVLALLKTLIIYYNIQFVIILFIYIPTAGWQKTFRSITSRLALDQKSIASRLAELKYYNQPAGNRRRLNFNCFFYNCVFTQIRCFSQCSAKVAKTCGQMSQQP